MKTPEEIAEEVRGYMEQNGCKAGSVYATTVVDILQELGYTVIEAEYDERS
jgi:hypothetical protein